VVIGIRADFYARSTAFPELVPHLQDHQVLVGPIDEAGLREAIEKPAALAGLVADAALVEVLLADLGLRAHPDVGCVLGRQELLLEPGVDPPDWVTAPPILAYGESEPGRFDQVPPMSMVVRRSVFDEVGPFDTRFTLSEDVDWILRLREKGIGLELLEDVVLIRRLHGRNLTYDSPGLQAAMFAVLRARIDRRRGER